VEVGNEPVSRVIERVADADMPAWARWACERVGSRWELRFAEIFVGAEPPAYAKRRWEYVDHLFIERPATVVQIKAALSGKTVRIGKISARGAPLNSTANRSRQQSHADFGGQRLPWPNRRYDVSRVEGARAAAGNDPLISQTSPSFAYFQAAFNAFFRPGANSRWDQTAGVVVVIADTGAYITSLRIKPGQVVVEVAGDGLESCVLQVSSDGHFETQAVRAPGAFTSALPDPFDHELLVVLADNDWRDLRVINPRGLPNAADPSIVWDDPGVQLEALVARARDSPSSLRRSFPTRHAAQCEQRSRLCRHLPIAPAATCSSASATRELSLD
jgi:hypothetical protein